MGLRPARKLNRTRSSFSPGFIRGERRWNRSGFFGSGSTWASLPGLEDLDAGDARDRKVPPRLLEGHRLGEVHGRDQLLQRGRGGIDVVVAVPELRRQPGRFQRAMEIGVRSQLAVIGHQPRPGLEAVDSRRQPPGRGREHQAFAPVPISMSPGTSGVMRIDPAGGALPTWSSGAAGPLKLITTAGPSTCCRSTSQPGRVIEILAPTSRMGGFDRSRTSVSAVGAAGWGAWARTPPARVRAREVPAIRQDHMEEDRSFIDGEE